MPELVARQLSVSAHLERHIRLQHVSFSFGSATPNDRMGAPPCNASCIALQHYVGLLLASQGLHST